MSETRKEVVKLKRVRVERADLLTRLERVQPGLSPKDEIQQSASFAFRGGRVYTFNDEVSCNIRSLLPKGLVGATKATPFLSMLRVLTVEVVDIEAKDGELIVYSQKAHEGFAVKMDPTIALPLDKVPEPDHWSELPTGFGDAVAQVSECVMEDPFHPFSYVHVHPRYVEACDTNQICRVQMRTGVAKSFLVRSKAIASIAAMGVDQVGETEEWVHFRAPTGLRAACRRYEDKYPPVEDYFDVSGSVKATLPLGLAEAAKRAEFFSKEYKDDNQVIVDMKPGKVRIRSVGTSGRYWKIMPLEYRGQPLKFKAGPKLLESISKRNTDVRVREDKMSVGGKKWSYVISLDEPDAKPGGHHLNGQQQPDSDQQQEED
jgi:hypothetical protein